MKNFKLFKSAFTQIELVFVIVIIGILATVAIPKLQANRTAAQLVIDIASMGTCIQEASVYYLTHGDHMPDAYSVNCDDVLCYTTTTNGSNLTVATNRNGARYCYDIEEIGGQLAKTYRF